MINKKYFKYLSKSLLSLIIVCAVIALMALAFFPALTFKEGLYYYDPKAFTYTDSMSNFFMVIVAIATAVPFIIHSRYYSKNSSDIYLSLPMDRKQAFITENLFGLMIVVGSTLVGFLVGVLFTFGNSFSLKLIETYGQLFQSLPLLLLTAIVSYLISNYAVNVSNSLIEGAIVLASLIGISLLIWGFTETFFYKLFDGKGMFLVSFSYVPGIFMYMTYGYTHMDWQTETMTVGYSDYGVYLLIILVNLLAWLALNFYAYRRFVRLKSEHLGTATMEPLGGPDTHAIAFGLLFIEVGALVAETFGEGYIDMFILLAILGAVIAYWVSLFVLRRKIEFRKDDLSRFAIACVGGLVGGSFLYVVTEAAKLH